MDEIKQDLIRQQTELDRLKISVSQAQVAMREAAQKNTPELALPKILYINQLPSINPPITMASSKQCRMRSCFDHSRCSFTSGFPVYFYDPDEVNVLNDGYDIEGFLKTAIKQTFSQNVHITNDPTKACVFVLLVGEALSGDELVRNNRYALPIENKLDNDLQPLNVTKLKLLKYWGGDGRNHILLNLSRRDLSAGAGNAFHNINTGRAMILQSAYNEEQYRKGYDIVIPPILGPPDGDVWQECAQMTPARRKFLLTFQGQLMNDSNVDINSQKISKDEETLNIFIIEHLKEMGNGVSQDKFLFEFECNPAIEQRGQNSYLDWMLCGTDSSRKSFLKQSTFNLIFSPGNGLISSTLFQSRLYESLRSGSIPVILGSDEIELPFSEAIEWRKVCVMLPKARITELHFMIRAISDSDLMLMRRQGRFVWERYMSTVKANLDTIIASIRDRLSIPPRPVKPFIAHNIFNATFVPLKSDPPILETEPDESLGPIEPPYASPAFKRNFTTFTTQLKDVWNKWGDPFYLYPQLPFDPVLPSDAKFIGSHIGFRPVGKGAGGAGKEFSEALGGNNPREQFTIVMLTYEREQVLMDSLGRLYGLPYLHKVIVVWNSPKPPLEDLRWPDIGVEIFVVKAQKNSLNNRFLPFDIIETEAVLSVDDDAHLRHDEILFGFRVWRENRDRIVGFPGRFHAWDLNTQNSWNYNSNYSCELSMVLTGAAFYHNYYNYLYSYHLPQAIRDKVDEYINCEDIAMNFLVSHVTRKPPVKVTSRWTFRCPGCPISLSEDDTHFQERHKCINFFSQIFGYMPLLNTQYRADSILFKTRIPHDKQKCFKYI